MIIEVSPRDVASFRELQSPEVASPEGLTVRYEGTMHFRSIDVAPLVTFAVVLSATVSANLISDWLRDWLKGRASKVTINRRQIDFGDEGQLLRIIEEERRIELR